MEKAHFFHALTLDDELCIGCSHCMRTCPTEAIRIVKGKAILNPDRCIDCGNCFKVCPTKAIFIKQDDFDSIFNYACRVALVPAVFMG